MTFSISHNGKQVARRIEKAIGAASNTAGTDRGLASMMKAGTARHLRIGALGGTMEEFKGGGLYRMISWDMSRHPSTMALNSSYPILRGRQDTLGRAFVRGPAVSQSFLMDGSGSRISVGPSSMRTIALGKVLQDGGKPLPSKTNQFYPPDFRIPARPFAFWDRQMVDQTIRRIARNFEEAAR